MGRIKVGLRRLLKTAPLLAALVTLGIAASGCHGSTPSAQNVTYAPAAYGVQVGTQFRCYYADDPGEVTALINSGLCPHNSVAYPMPLSWEEEYWAYYSSPSYYSVYMPSQYRSHYTSVTVVHFSSTYKTQITSAESSAKYKGSNGSLVTGTSKVKFGSGNGVSAGHGGGSGRSGCSLNMTTVQMKGGGSSSGHGGGSGRSGTSGSKTVVKPKVGC
jgi:hypothetical protein